MDPTSDDSPSKFFLNLNVDVMEVNTSSTTAYGGISSLRIPKKPIEESEGTNILDKVGLGKKCCKILLSIKNFNIVFLVIKTARFSNVMSNKQAQS